MFPEKDVKEEIGSCFNKGEKVTSRPAKPLSKGDLKIVRLFVVKFRRVVVTDGVPLRYRVGGKGSVLGKGSIFPAVFDYLV